MFGSNKPTAFAASLHFGAVISWLSVRKLTCLFQLCRGSDRAAVCVHVFNSVAVP